MSPKKDKSLGTKEKPKKNIKMVWLLVLTMETGKGVMVVLEIPVHGKSLERLYNVEITTLAKLVVIATIKAEVLE